MATIIHHCTSQWVIIIVIIVDVDRVFAQLAPTAALGDATLTLAVVLLPQAAAALLGAWRVASMDALHTLRR